MLDIRKDFDPERVFITNVNGFTMSTFAIKDSPNHYMDYPKDYHIRFNDYNSLINLFKEKGFVEKTDYVAGYVSTGYILVNSLTSKMTCYLLYGKTGYPTPERVGEQEVYMDPKLNAMIADGKFKFTYNAEDSNGKESCFRLVGWDTKYGLSSDSPGVSDLISILKPNKVDTAILDIVAILRHCGFGYDEYKFYVDDDVFELHTYTPKMATFIVDHLSNYNAEARMELKKRINSEFNKMKTAEKFEKSLGFIYDRIDSSGDTFKVVFKLIDWDRTEFGNFIDYDTKDYYVMKDRIYTIMNAYGFHDTEDYYVESRNDHICLIVENDRFVIDFVLDHLCINADKNFLKDVIHSKINKCKPKSNEDLKEDKPMEEDMDDAVDVITPKEEVKPTTDSHAKCIKNEIECQIISSLSDLMAANNKLLKYLYSYFQEVNKQ